MSPPTTGTCAVCGQGVHWSPPQRSRLSGDLPGRWTHDRDQFAAATPHAPRPA